MNSELNYLKIKLNEILNKESNLGFILNSWIHLVKINSVGVPNYDLKDFFLKNILQDFAKNILKIFINFFSFTNNKSFKDKYYDFLIISHKLNSGYMKNDEDLYYGNLKEYLKKNNLKYKFVYLNHSKFSKNDHSFFLNECNFWNKVKVFFRIIKTSIYFFIKYRKRLKKELLIKIFFEFFSIFTFYNFIIFENLKKISEKNKIKYIITTFEGYSWEKAVFSSQKNFETQTIGYQHSFISKENNTILEIYNKDLIPDVVLTTGEITEDIFKKKNIFNKVKILGNAKIFKISNKIKMQKKKFILVAPDGVESECVKMIEFISKYDIKNCDYKFIIRLHPILNLENLKKKYSIFNQNFKNIIFSKEKIEFDLERSAFCLYSSSTIAFNCILSDVEPIYVNLNNLYSTNVLNEVDEVKKIDDISQLEECLKIRKINTKALTFTKKYFYKFDFDVLKSL